MVEHKWHASKEWVEFDPTLYSAKNLAFNSHNFRIDGKIFYQKNAKFVELYEKEQTWYRLNK